MGNARLKNEDWEQHKAAILELYVKKDMALKDVASIMAGRGFSGTKPQYERTFKKWGISKNVHKSEWTFICNRLQEREDQHKASEIKVRGLLLSQTRIKKERQRYGLTTYERYRKQMNPSPGPETPPGIEVYTPQPLVCSELGQNDEISESIEVSIETLPGDLGEQTEAPISGQRTSPDRHITSSTPRPSFDQFYGLPSTQDGDEGIMEYYEDRLSISKATQIAKYDMTRISQLSDADIRSYIDRALMRYVAGSMSAELTKMTVLALARDERAIPALQEVLRMKLPVIDYIARTLLIPASKDGNLLLVKTLIEYGVDPNTRGALDSDPKIYVTALQCAIHIRRVDMVEYLLGFRITYWIARFQVGNGVYITGSLLDALIEMNFTSCSEREKEEKHIGCQIMKILLRHRYLSFGFQSVGLWRTLRRAILRNRIDYCRILLEHFPELLEDARKKPGILLEAAASCQGITMYRALEDLLGTSATDGSFAGSVLTSAVKHSNDELVRFLLSTNVDNKG